MSNTIKIMTLINKEFKRRFAKSVPFFNLVNRQYDKRYEYVGARPGETIQIKRPQRAEVYETMTYVPQNFVEETTTLDNIYWAGSGLNFSAAELTDDLMEPNNLKLFADDNLQAAVDAISANVHYRLSTYIFNNTYNNVGTPGTALANHQALTQARARLTSYGAPTSNRSVVLNPDETSGLNYGMASLQNGAAQISKQLVDGYVGPVSGFDLYESIHLATHTRGTATNVTPLVDGANQTGASILLKGVGNAVTYKAGDKINIAGVKAVHPVSKQIMPFLQDFTVLNDETSSAGGAVTLDIFPSIVITGNLQTVNAAPAGDAAVTIKGTASKLCNQGIAMHKDAFVFATQRIANIGAPAEMAFVEDNITFKLTLGADVNNMTSLSRMDMKFGMGKLMHEHACIIWGAETAA